MVDCDFSKMSSVILYLSICQNVRARVTLALVFALITVMLCAQALSMQIETLHSARFGSAIGFASFGNGTRGGAGGAVRTVWDAWALRDALTGNDRRIIYVKGRIDLTPLFNGSPGVVLEVGSWKTIIGGDQTATIIGGGLRIRRNQQVIIQNIKFDNVISYTPGETNRTGIIIPDLPREVRENGLISIEEAEYVWIDHNEFADDPWINGLLEIKRASNWVTISHNIFRNKNILIGHNDNNAAQDVGRLKVSIFYNWFMGTTQPNPIIRCGEVHVLNNLYTNKGSYGIGIGVRASVYAEKNVFNIAGAGWKHPDSVPNAIGNLLNVDNFFQNKSFDAVPSDVRWNPNQYFSYAALGIGNVEAYVRHVAGTW